MNDFDLCYRAAPLAFLAGYNPYPAVQCFASPPWSLPFLIPFAWVPWWLAMLLPFAALLFLSIRFRKPWLLLIVGASFPFLSGSLYANINWITMIGAALGGPLGAILCTVKPQEGLFIIPALISKERTTSSRLRLLLPLAALILIFSPLLATWLVYMFKIGHGNDGIRNFSLFPYTIPFGLAALYLAWKRRDTAWGALASLLLAPYFYIHSSVTLLFLVANRNWRWGAALNLALWGLFVVIAAGVISIDL